MSGSSHTEKRWDSLCFFLVAFICFVHFVTVASIGLLIVTEKTETHTLLSGNSQPQGRGRALMSYNRDMLKVVRQEMNLQEVTGRTSEK